MSAVFELDHSPLAADARFQSLARALESQTRIDSRESFNRYCREACRLWTENVADAIGATTEKFDALIERVERGGDEIIQTGWGGVLIAIHEPPSVEKYLVIRRGGYLALETHSEKDERLTVTEGAGLLLSSQAGSGRLTVEVLLPGSRHHFLPGSEHCIIGTANLLVFEQAIDPRGMDQDLIFIYEPNTPSHS